MKIDLEMIESLPHYVIRDGVAIFVQVDKSISKNASYETGFEDTATNVIENTSIDEEKKNKSITHEELKSALENAQITGRKGEEFVNNYLDQKKNADLIDNFDWISNTNAIAPYDFIIRENNSSIHIDVKSTNGEFFNIIHISISELLEMEKEKSRYQIYRVYAIGDSEARLRIAENLSSFANQIIGVFKALPEYVKADGINLPPDELEFGEELTIWKNPL